MKEFQTLLLEDRGPIRIITVNRPKVLNALNPTVVSELYEAFSTLQGPHPGDVRGVVLCGAGEKAFVAGADIAAMAEMSEDEAMTFASSGHAVGDLIAADHAGAHRLAMNQLRGDFARAIGELREGLIGFAGLLELELDFAEEDVEFADRSQFDALLGDLLGKVGSLADSFRTGNAIREGIPVAIIGAPNRGKSTLLNTLLGDERAIVSATAGTTRDTIEDTCIIDGKKFRFMDTAGIRETTDEIESEGIRRALDKAQGASIVLYLFDASVDGAEDVDQALAAAAIGPGAQTAVVWNKTDLAAAPGAHRDLEFHVSAAQGLGIEELKNWLAEWGNESQASDALMVTNFRHYEALVEARAALEATRQGLLDGIPGDLVASDVRQALHHLGSITGEIDPEDILDHIFSNFCIGK